jgi:hypothetical protein
MKGDFSRVTFDVANHFSRVLMQQGRVTLDADANEQAAILLHYLRTLARDLIGPYGGPAGSDQGFHLEPSKVTNKSATTWTLGIGNGRYYVDGILCENAGTWTYAHQPDYTPPHNDVLLGELAKSAPSMPSKAYWLYLDVWERHITPIEDTHMREVALGGPDTCTRTKVVWQVKAQELNVPMGGDPCTAQLAALTAPSTARMAAELDPGQQIKDPCVVAPDARYRGAENQLYRVEIHRGGTIEVVGGRMVETTNGPTFKWSRDNGSVATAWLGTDGNDLLVASARGFSAGAWVELSDDVQDLRGSPGTLVKLSSVDGNRLRVDAGSSPPAWNADLKKPKVRRWDQTENDDVTLTQGAIAITDDPKLGWIDLEDGVRVQFGAGDYHSGDYWLIPARVATGDIEWPRTASGAVPLPPRGIQHHYAPLGQLTWSGQTWDVTSCLCTLKTVATPENAGGARVAPTPPSPTPPQPQPPQPAPAPTPAQPGRSK